ncbi:hypothetical protein LTR84_008185 [Exophiala bonariae]|uniref:Uncharacterized protein n=1 Tax=Exophiala bonariae TaxID=1690606 RepID=A0AAV9MXS1_9EURO|nr:hypothetical protein LTR84_008185 [Exophiala bonariae]
MARLVKDEYIEEVVDRPTPPQPLRDITSFSDILLSDVNVSKAVINALKQFMDMETIMNMQPNDLYRLAGLDCDVNHGDTRAIERIRAIDSAIDAELDKPA